MRRQYILAHFCHPLAGDLKSVGVTTSVTQHCATGLKGHVCGLLQATVAFR